MTLIWRTLCTLVLALAAQTSAAATLEQVGPVQTDARYGCSLRLSGPIQPGDADMMRRQIWQLTSRIDNYPSGRRESQVVLCLDSEGGSLTEGMQIAHLVYDRSVSTRINPGETCLSACALVFMAGNLDLRSGEGWIPSRYMHPLSTLGFHAPDLVLPEGSFTRNDVQSAYRVAIAAVALISREADKFRIDRELLTEMVNHLGQDFYYIDRVDSVQMHGISLYGYATPPLTQEAINTACSNAWRWFTRQVRPEETLADFARAMASFRISRQNGLPEFFPFDGSMFCKHGVRSTGAGDVDHILLSEWADLRDPRLDRGYPTLARFPGPMLLRDLPL